MEQKAAARWQKRPVIIAYIRSDRLEIPPNLPPIASTRPCLTLLWTTFTAIAAGAGMRLRDRREKIGHGLEGCGRRVLSNRLEKVVGTPMP
jgi:hypothetical protein